eukprot:m.205947 g.205947  ORF g.205947 m.205947 type:complete len:232 (-) comp15420_c2_seq3:1558-2253(-)
MAAAETRVGVLGGGQLGRMLAEAAHNNPNLTVIPLDPLGPASPAGQVASKTLTGSFKDAAAVTALAEACDVITAEIEHVNCDVLDQLVAKGKVVRPSPQCIRMIQDKFRQKQHFAANGVPVGPFAEITDVGAAVKFGEVHGYPYMLKARLGAYDGRVRADVSRTLDRPSCGCVTKPRPPVVAAVAVACAACLHLPPLSRVPMGGCGWRCGATVIPPLPCIAEARPAARPTG